MIIKPFFFDDVVELVFANVCEIKTVFAASENGVAISQRSLQMALNEFTCLPTKSK